MVEKDSEKNPNDFNYVLNNTLGPLMMLVKTAKLMEDRWPEIWYEKGYEDALKGNKFDFKSIKEKMEKKKV